MTMTQDTAQISVCGILEKIIAKDTGTEIVVKCKEMHYPFWVSAKDERINLLSDFVVGNFVKVVGFIKNNNYDNKEGEKVYSYSFYLKTINYVSSDPAAKFQLVGRLTKELDIRHIDAVDADYAIGCLATNVNNTTIYVHFMHKEMNENCGIVSQKGMRLVVSGNVAVSKNGYSFYANELFVLRKGE